MAKAKAPKPYEPVAKSTSIRCTSRVSVKIKDNFYTFEFMEERVIPADAVVEEIVQMQKQGR